MRPLTGLAAAIGSLLLTAAIPGCEAQNLGQPPPGDRFIFPSGLLLDPLQRVEAFAGTEGLPPKNLDLPGPRYLYVANGNNDRTYSAGTVLAIDLREFWRAWYDPHRDDPAQAACLAAIDANASDVLEVCAARDPRRGGLDPFCNEGDTDAHDRCVLPPGSDIPDIDTSTTPKPCRRLPLLPHIVECDEGPFVVSSVRVGDFATTLAASIEEDDRGESFTRLWLPVRGDPSITFIDIDASAGEGMLQCGQGGDPLDPELCGDDHRLSSLRNDPELDSIDREPFNTLIWEREAPSDNVRGQRLAFVAHASGSELTVVDLDGLQNVGGPAIVDLAPIYSLGGRAAGGFGLATRPCFEAGMGPLGASDPLRNVPSLTQGCTRPLMYTSLRFFGRLISFTASGLEVEARLGVAPANRVDCMVEGIYAGPYCATTEQLAAGQPCAIDCEVKVRGSRGIIPALLFDTSLRSSPILGDMAFADPRGDQLLVIETNPGALISLDTSLNDNGEPLDIPSAPPVEICAEPSRMKIHTEYDAQGVPAQRYALITCFRAALVYVVDLEALRVVEAIVVGTGPHDLAIDEEREVAYVINNLEFSISVIDLSRWRSTRFQEMARLGLQDPFSQ